MKLSTIALAALLLLAPAASATNTEIPPAVPGKEDLNLFPFDSVCHGPVGQARMGDGREFLVYECAGGDLLFRPTGKRSEGAA